MAYCYNDIVRKYFLAWEIIHINIHINAYFICCGILLKQAYYI